MNKEVYIFTVHFDVMWIYSYLDTPSGISCPRQLLRQVKNSFIKGSELASSGRDLSLSIQKSRTLWRHFLCPTGTPFCSNSSVTDVEDATLLLSGRRSDVLLFCQFLSEEMNWISDVENYGNVILCASVQRCGRTKYSLHVLTKNAIKIIFAI